MDTTTDWRERLLERDELVVRINFHESARVQPKLIHENQLDHASNPCVSQVGKFSARKKAASFPHKPGRNQWELSAVIGALTVDDAVTVAMQRACVPKDRVRHLSVEKLQRNDFLAFNTPSRKNPNHASVVPNVPEPWTEEGLRCWERPPSKPRLNDATI